MDNKDRKIASLLEWKWKGQEHEGVKGLGCLQYKMYMDMSSILAKDKDN